MLSPDYGKRDYLLPDGCKDLIDVINLEKRHRSVLESVFALPTFPTKNCHKLSCHLGELPGVPPPIKGEIVVCGATTVAQLASLVKQAQASIIADLMVIGVFAKPNQVVGFEAVRKVARKYGYAVKKIK